MGKALLFLPFIYSKIFSCVYLTKYMLSFMISSFSIAYSESDFDQLQMLKFKAIRTAGSTADGEGFFTFIDCVKSANFISWQLNCQLVTS